MSSSTAGLGPPYSATTIAEPGGNWLMMTIRPESGSSSTKREPRLFWNWAAGPKSRLDANRGVRAKKVSDSEEE